MAISANLRQMVLDAIDAGLVILDRDRRIVHWNAWMDSASGHRADAVAGKRLHDVFPGRDFERLTAAITAAFESGASSLLTHALHPGLFPLRTRAGRTLLHDVTVTGVGRGGDASCLVHIADV